MRYTDEELETIADETGYDCHLYHQPLTFHAYGDCYHPEGWEVDHVRPRSKKRYNGFSNLFAAHTHCNRKKGNRSNRKIRSQFGVTGKPPSTLERFLKGAGYVALGLRALWLMNEALKPSRKMQLLSEPLRFNQLPIL